MDELIRINFDSDCPTVSGRELHDALEVGTKYVDWFSRMCEYGFVETQDYFPILRNRSDVLPGKPMTDHQLTIDMAKQLCMASVGKVYVEALIIAYGEGRNGKSTFWNTIARVLGTYAGNMSADTLTVGCKRNVKPEMAELKGKRLVIAAELEEGMRLNTSVIKQLCSTDDIYAEKKYKDPFKFTPSHTIVLYTNHLPRVGANDEGTWRRLIVIPFDAKIEGRSDIKNYADYLYQNAGSYIMTWIIEGAQKVIKQNFKLSVPPCVSEATDIRIMVKGIST